MDKPSASRTPSARKRQIILDSGDTDNFGLSQREQERMAHPIDPNLAAKNIPVAMGCFSEIMREHFMLSRDDKDKERGIADVELERAVVERGKAEAEERTRVLELEVAKTRLLVVEQEARKAELEAPTRQFEEERRMYEVKVELARIESARADKENAVKLKMLEKYESGATATPQIMSVPRIQFSPIQESLAERLQQELRRRNLHISPSDTATILAYGASHNYTDAGTLIDNFMH